MKYGKLILLLVAFAAIITRTALKGAKIDIGAPATALPESISVAIDENEHLPFQFMSTHWTAEPSSVLHITSRKSLFAGE